MISSAVQSLPVLMAPILLRSQARNMVVDEDAMRCRGVVVSWKETKSASGARFLRRPPRASQSEPDLASMQWTSLHDFSRKRPKNLIQTSLHNLSLNSSSWSASSSSLAISLGISTLA